MSVVAIIPARGGSKRIARKNIKDFLGKPIIAYSIEASIQSGLFDEVMVSTDDEEIAQLAIKYGAQVPFMRSSNTSDDYSSTSDVILEVLKNYSENGKQFKYACCIYPTAPLITIKSLKSAFTLLTSKAYRTVFPVVAFSYPIWRSLNVLEQGKVEMFWPENQSKRSQDLPNAWHDAGQFYWLNVLYFLKEPSLFSSNSGSIELSEFEVQDIDSPEDWQLAELKAQLK